MYVRVGGKLKRIFERVPEGKDPLLIGPETIVFSEDSKMYTFTEDGKIVRLENLIAAPNDANTVYADVVEIAASIGRPLGGKFVPGTQVLYFADVLLGLCRIDLSNKHPKIELVASKVQTEDGRWSPILFADDVDIGTKSGMIYFSDASYIPPGRDPDLTYDVLYAFKTSFLQNERSGRLLRYNPRTEEVKVLADGIFFANGIAVDKDETSVIVNESSMFRVLKYHLTGSKQGELEVAVGSLPGFVDGADCSHTSGMCYVVMPTSVTGLTKTLLKMPATAEAIFRTLLMMLPKELSPQPENYTGIVEIAKIGSESKVNRIIQDPDGEDIWEIAGVTENDGKLYLGSLNTDFIGVYDLD